MYEEGVIIFNSIYSYGLHLQCTQARYIKVLRFFLTNVDLIKTLRIVFIMNLQLDKLFLDLFEDL